MISQSLAQKLIFYIAILFSLSLALSRAGVNVFGFLLLVVWLIEGRFKDKIKELLQNKFTLSIILFLLYQVVVLLWVEPDNIFKAIEYSFKYIYFLIILVLYNTFPPQKNMILLYAFFVSITISSLESFSIYFHLFHIKEINENSLSPHMWHTIYSIFLAVSSLVSLVLLLNTKIIWKKLIFFVLFLETLLILFLGISRTGQMIFIIGFIMILSHHYEYKFKSFIISFLALISILIIAYTQTPFLKSRIDIAKHDIVEFQKHRNYCSSLGSRIFTWKVAGNILQATPIIGLGTQDHLDFLKHSIESDPKFSKCNMKNMIGYYHNQYLELIAQSGLIGLMFLLLIFYTLWKIDIKNNTVQYIKVILIIAFLLSFYVDVPFRKMFTLALFAHLSSIILLQKKVEK